MTDEMTQDEYGKEVRAQYKKVIEPRPHEEDLTRVRTGITTEDYAYVDATTLFQLERLIPLLKDCKNKSQRREAGKGFPKYTRDLADLAEPVWPAAGYVVRLGGHLSDYDHDAARAIAGADVLQFPSASEKLGQWLDNPTESGLFNAAAEMAAANDPELFGTQGSLLEQMAPELVGEADPEVENAGAVPG